MPTAPSSYTPYEHVIYEIKRRMARSRLGGSLIPVLTRDLFVSITTSSETASPEY